MIPFFKLYARYITGQRRAAQKLAALRKSKGKLQDFLLISERCAGHQVSRLMEIPIFRLPQYLVFLGGLLKKLDPASGASSDTKGAIVAIQKVTDHISLTLKDDAQRNLVVRFQEKMFKGSVALVSPSRLVLKYGCLEKVYNKQSSFVKSKKYMFVLFNDMILYSTIRTALQSAKVKHVLQLDGMTIHDVPEKSQSPVQLAFVLCSNTKSFVVVCQSAKEKKEWMDAINNAIKMNESIQRQLVGQSVPYDGAEFEKMVLKKKYRVVKNKVCSQTSFRQSASILMVLFLCRVKQGLAGAVSTRHQLGYETNSRHWINCHSNDHSSLSLRTEPGGAHKV